jgi:hypothetical protein
MEVTSSAPDRLVKLGVAFRDSKTLLSAVELGVFTLLAQGPLELGPLAEETGVHTRGARDFFDALLALRLVERDESGRYSNAADVNQYLDRNKASYIGGELELANARQFGPWSMLTDALRTGKPQSGARGTENYRAYYADSAVLENVARGMTGGSLRAAAAMAARFPWQEFRTLFDIGTSQGCLPVQIALAHPHITGGGFDLPALKPLFESYAEQHGVADRLRFRPGDFFDDPLPAADVLVMGRVLHNWDLASKMLLLGKAFDALPAGGILIVYERMIDDDRRTGAAGLLASLNMLVLTAGGFDYSPADCKGWMTETGFRNVEVSPLMGELTMITGRKP